MSDLKEKLDMIEGFVDQRFDRPKSRPRSGQDLPVRSFDTVHMLSCLVFFMTCWASLYMIQHQQQLRAPCIAFNVVVVKGKEAPQ
jgi:hypothetical protein